MKNALACLVLLFGTIGITYAQNNNISKQGNWRQMMLNPEANFFETQKIFYDYFEGKETVKGDGSKVFKRWEDFWKDRVDENGNFPEQDLIAADYYQFLEDYPPESGLKSGQVQWVELGPRNREVWKDEWGIVGNGRLNTIAFHPSDENTIYVGAPNGGLWITNDSGENWETHTDHLPSLGVSAIAIHPEEPNRILIGTGDRDGNRAWIRGAMRSEDGGQNWEEANSGLGYYVVGNFAQNEEEPNTLIAATSKGLFKTSDFGTQWRKVSTSSEFFFEVYYKQGDINIAFASSSNGFYRSADGGENWTLLGEEQGITKSGRIAIGVSPSSPDSVYLLIGDAVFEGCFLSVDGGQSFTLQSDSPNIMGGSALGDDERGQCWYDIYIVVDPKDSQTIHMGGINTWKSIDAGLNWQLSSHWTGDAAPLVHADHHYAAINPLNGRMYDGNDGGIYWTENGGDSWHNMSSGLGIGQLFKLGVSATNKNMTSAGFQDNGSATLTESGWITTGPGDGMETIIDPDDESISYTTMQNGHHIARWKNNTEYTLIKGLDPPVIDELGAWVIPISLSEWNSKHMVAGWKNLWMTKNVKGNVENLNWEKIEGLDGEINSHLVEFSPADENLLYYVKIDQTMYVTENLLDEPEWTNLTPRLPGQYAILDLEANPYDKSSIFMARGYEVFESNNQGQTWRNITWNLPNNPVKRDLAFDRTSSSTLYIATDAGIYSTDLLSETWTLHGANFPVSVFVEEIEIYYDASNRDDSRIRAATYGRGLWEAHLASNEAPPLLPPSFLNSTIYDTDVELNWTSPHYPREVLSYNIYRNEELVGNSSGNDFLDKDALLNSSALYRVSANYADGESIKSNETIAITPVPFPYEQNLDSGTGGLLAAHNSYGWQYGSSDSLNIAGNDNNFFGIYSPAAGEKALVEDVLYIPQINLAEHNDKTVTLSFDYALRVYRNYDELSVVYRSKHGGNWITLEELNSTGNNDWLWKNYSIDLPQDLLIDSLQIGFMYSDSKGTGWGAGIDNIHIFQNTTGVEIIQVDNELKVFPNPNDGNFMVHFQLSKLEKTVIELYDLSGKKIFQEYIYPEGLLVKHSFNISNYPPGQYVLKIENSNIQLRETVLVK